MVNFHRSGHKYVLNEARPNSIDPMHVVNNVRLTTMDTNQFFNSLLTHFNLLLAHFKTVKFIAHLGLF